jgi:serine/threonine protein kinase
MTPESRRRIEELFHLALGREPGERDAFLAQVCPDDPSVCAEVKRLLISDADSDAFMELPAVELLARRAADAGGPFDPTLRSDEPPARHVPLSPGEKLGGRWVVERELARGGIGVVYLARDSKLARPVVVKTLLAEHLGNEWVANKFKHEREALARVEHRGVVAVLDADQTPAGTPYLVMQYVEGVDLARALRSWKLMDLGRAASIIRQAGRALDAAHEEGVLHRDLKPSNIMLHRTSDGVEEVKLIDFGIAKLKSPLGAPGTNAPRLAGTVAYMAPEQLRAEPLSAASDVYSLGVIAYEMVTGRKPFETTTPFVMAELQRAGVGEPPRLLRPDLPETAQAAILKALSFHPADRYQSAREFAETLADALTGAPSPPREPKTSAGRESSAERSKPSWPRKVKRPRAVPRLVLAVALLLTACVGAFVLWQVKSEGTKATALNLSYWIDVQKYRDGKPYGAPFRLPGEVIFEKDYRIWLGVSSPLPGYLYVVNEGPQSAPSRPDYNLLFPLPTKNDGAPLLQAGREVKIPEEGSMRFDDQEGTERLWLIYSARPVPELDAVSETVNKSRNIEISDPAQARAVQEFINLYAASKPRVEKGERLTSVSGESDIVVHEIKLEHH